VASDTNAHEDVYLFDVTTGDVESISLAGDDGSNWPVVSDDGTAVAFVSVATNLIPGGTDGTQHCYHYDVAGGTTTIVDFGDDAAEANSACHQPAISGDGTVVAYHSEATNLIEDDGNALIDVFVYDLDEYSLTRASVAADGGDLDEQSFHPSLNYDGRFVAFQSHSDGLTPTGHYSADPDPVDGNGFADVFVRDLWTNQTFLVSMLPDGTQGNEGSYEIELSDDGRYAAFHSIATNLPPDDVNIDPADGWDVFLADRGPIGEVLIVDSTGDAADADPGNGSCLSTLGGCTLRAAIEEANAHPGRDYIFFDITGPGPHTITPAADFDHISEDVVIDARTQPGYDATPLIVLDGAAAPSPSSAFFFLSGDSFVGGLSIANFGTGISAIDGDLVITSNVMTGGNYGIVILDTSTAVVADNIISGNASNGIQVGSTAVAWIVGNEIFGNGDSGITNYGANHPGPVTLTHASTGGYTTISGSLPALATDFTLHVYGNTSCDPSGFGEGEYLLFEHLYDGPPTDGFTITVPQGFGPGTITTATVSGQEGSGQGTSEFSNCVTMDDGSFIEVAADAGYEWVDLINLLPGTAWNVSLFEDEFAVSPLQTETVTTDGEGNGRANFGDIVPGNYVVAEQVPPGTGVHSTVVVPLRVDTWDTDAEFVEGAADPGTTVVVLVENPASTYVEFLTATADPTGYWSIDFAGLGYDFPFSFNASARVVDDDGDTTLAFPPVIGGPVWEHLTFQFGPDNRNPDTLNEHLKFRQAIAHAIDKDLIATIMGLYPIDSYVTAYDPALSQDAWAQYDYDPAEAGALIDQLCADLDPLCDTNPPTVVFTINEDRPERVALAAALEPMLETAGIQMIQDLEVDLGDFADAIFDGTLDVAEWAWGSDGNLVAIHDIFDPEGDPDGDPPGQNYYRWGTPDSSVIDANTVRFAELRDLMNEATDEMLLIDYLNEAEQILADQVVIIPLGIRVDAALDPTVTITADPTTTEPGASEVPISAIPIDRLAAALAGETGPGATPLGSIELAGTPLGSIPLGSIPLGSIAPGSTPLGSILLSSLPLGSIGGWDALLAGTVLQGMPLQTITLAEVFAAAATDPALDAALAALPLGSIDLAGSPLGSIPLGSILLGVTDINGTPLGSIPLGSIPLSDIDLSSAPLGSIPLGSIPLGSIPLGSIPLGSIPLGSIPLGSIPIGLTPLGSIPLGSIPLGSIPLGSIPLGSIDLAGTPLGSIPLGSIDVGGDFCTWLDGAGGPTCASLGISDTNTLYEFALAVEALGSHVAATPLGSIPLGSIPLGSIPLGSIPLGSIPLGSISLSELPLGSIDLAGTPLGSIPLGSIEVGDEFCTWLDGEGGPTCAALGITDANNLYEFALAVEAQGSTVGASPLGSIPLGSIPLGSIPLGSIPLGSIPLGSINLDGTPLGSIPLGSIDVGGDFCTWLTNAGGPTCAVLGIDGSEILYDFALAVEAIGSTVGATPLGSIPLGSIGLDFLYSPGTVADVTAGWWGDLTVGDLLFALLLASDYAWEDVPLDALGIQDYVTGPTVDYEVGFTIYGSGGAVPATATVDLPAGFRYVAGSGVFDAIPAEPVVTESAGAQQLVWHLSVSPNTYVLGFSVAPGLGLGTFTTTTEIALFSLGQSTTATGAPVTVIPAAAFTTNTTLEDAHDVATDVLYLPYLATPDQLSYFKIPVPLAGKRTAVFLSHLGTDADLVMYRPVSSVAEPPGARSVPLGSIPFEDDGLDFTGEQPLEPDTLADIALASLPLGSISTNRGTSDESASISQRSDPEPGDHYTIQVSGYEGATSDDAYVLRVKEVAEAPIPVCPARSFAHAGDGVPGGYDPGTLPASLEAVFLVNYERLGDLYGAAAAGNVATALDAMAGYLTGSGMPTAVVPVGGALDSGLYGPWDANPCDPNAANAVSVAIIGLLADIRAAHPTLTYVTLVGSDEVIPLARIPDLTVLANEKHYAATFAGNALYGTLATSHFLSDDPYGDVDPIPWLDRYLYVPELGVGRLVETPDQIVAQLDRFRHPTVDGMLDPATAFVSGYDFLSDGAHAVEANLAGYTVTSLINETWDDSALIAGLASADVLSPNAHYDHYRALPADQSAAGTETELVTVGDVPTAIDDGVVFTMGCHGGLNVADTAAGGAEAADWAQAYAGTGAVFVANSGYGYGDTASVALSERLMADFAANLDGTFTAGRALAFAKQAYFADLGLHGVYDEKALQQAVFYGLPMYSIGNGSLPAPPAEPDTETDPVTGLIAAAFVDEQPDFDEVFTDSGTYYAIDGETQGIHYRPIQPRTDIDVTADGLVAMGAVFTVLTSSDVALDDPVFLRPTIDYAPAEPEVSTEDVIFPTTFQTIATYNAPAATDPYEQRQQLNVIPGQYLGSLEIQRLFTSFDTLVYYSPVGVTDFTPPAITRVDAAIVGDQASFVVEATDDAGIARVLVLYRGSVVAGESAWIAVDLVEGSPWTGGGPVGPGIDDQLDYMVQVVDAYGNVGVSTYKGEFHQAVALPDPPDDPDVTIDVIPDWYTAFPISIGVVSDLELRYSIDGEGDDPITNDEIEIGSDVGDGPHTISIWGEGYEASFGIAIDATPPEITIATPPSGAVYELGTSVAASFACIDAGSGIATCTGTPANGAPLPTDSVGEHTITITAADNVGHSSTAARSYDVVEPAGLTVAPNPAEIGQEVVATATFTETSQVVTAIIDWGDGDTCHTDVDLDCSVVGGTVDATHAYGAAGVSAVNVTVFHGDSLVQTTDEVFLAVFDPTAGSVSGHGRVTAPPGSFTESPGADPVIKFGVSGRYKKGATAPTGKVRIDVRDPLFDGWDFDTDALTSLFVAGDTALVKGTATTDSGDQIFFSVGVLDVDPSGHTDAFRIRIWDGSGEVWLDTGLGVPDWDPGGLTTLVQGQIMVRAK
jgi:CSLREA domain-containing protein